MIEYECTATGCGDDKYIEWNGRNLPQRITVGGSRADDTPTARGEFAYGPDGARYHRKTSYMDGETLRTENTYYVGSFEELLPRAGAAHTSIRQTRVTDGVRHVKTTAVSTADDGTKTTNTAKYVDYIHKDHLGSVEGVTGAAGARTRTLAHDPFGSRRKADWTAALTDAEVSALAGSSDPRTRGHTGHEHLDRTGFIHRGGRVYDPALGRFLSPDPLVGNRGSAQSWNGYSYVSNSPMSFVDPSGLSQAPGGGGCDLVGVMCGAAGGGFGLASVVSTHRFQWVDIFFSVSSLITLDWGSGSGVIYNYSGESDPYFGGWGWGSFDAFAGVSYGYSYWSGSVRVTSQVPVTGTPDIPGRDIARGTGRLNHRQVERRVSFKFGVDEAGAHWYIFRGLICRSSTEGCDDDLAKAVFDHVNRNDVPPPADDLGSGRKILIGNNPIEHTEYKKGRRTVNEAEEGHILEGTVDHRVHLENGDLYYEVRGTGRPGERYPGVSNFLGRIMFLPGVNRAVRVYGR